MGGSALRLRMRKMIPVFGLRSIWPSFEIGPYHFQRVDDYDKRVDQLPHPETLHTTWNSETGEKTDSVTPGRGGGHAHTYDAAIDQDEPSSKLFEKGGPLLIDIVILMRLFLGRGVYLEHELNTFPARFQGELIVHDPYFIKELSRILESAEWDRAKRVHLGPSLYYYFRSCTTDMINFAGADLAIAWDMLASSYADAYRPPGKEDFLKRKGAAIRKLDPVLEELRSVDKEMTDRISGALGNVSFDYLADQAAYLVGEMGLLQGINRKLATGRIRTFISYIRGHLIHSGMFPEPKKGWTNRAQHYATYAMRVMYALTCARLLGVQNVFQPIIDQTATMKKFFGDEEPTFRGEHPFTENQSRFEEQLRMAPKQRTQRHS